MGRDTVVWVCGSCGKKKTTSTLEFPKGWIIVKATAFGVFTKRYSVCGDCREGVDKALADLLPYW